MPATKRAGDDDSDSLVTKLPRCNSDADTPGTGKKKVPGSTRTGQACDRCKIRKIRCDARPGGCSPCLQNSSECKTTDRITGRATSRGHAENLENENAALKMHLLDLQQQLRDNGIDPKPQPIMQPAAFPSGTTPSFWGQMQSSSWNPLYNGNGTDPRQALKGRQNSAGSLLPDFRPGCIGDNYLGVSSETNWLSSIEGTSLALFGTKIDLTTFMPAENHPTSSAMSYTTFLDHALNKTQTVSRPRVPPLVECKRYADEYFRHVQAFIPILHKPDYMRLLERSCQHGYKPTPAEVVQLHMVLAVIHFQSSMRNTGSQSWHDAISHYHYAISFIPQLIAGHTLEDIQALTLICSQLRNQPRPGAAWMFTNMVLGNAIEMGLHRSSTAWENGHHDAHQLEMRKRTFWSLLLFHVHLSGKLGRPMPLRFEDFDIEIPEPAYDNMPDEANISKWKKCSFRAGIEGFKLLKIMHQVYASIYSIRSTGQYEMNVKQLENELEKFQAQLPQELRLGAHTRQDDRVSALYLDISVAECQLLLHHPSLCRSQATNLMNSNLDVCLHWSSRLLSDATELKDLNSLDTNWYFTTDFLAAIFTTLFAYTERRDQMTSEHAQHLRSDMDQWLEIMDVVGSMLGTGTHLREAIQSIVNSSLDHINRHLALKTASAAVVASNASPGADPPQAATQHHNLYDTTSTFSPHSFPSAQSNNDLSSHAHPQPSYTEASQTANYHHPPMNAFNTYSAAQTDSMVNYSPFDATSYSPANGDVKPDIEAALAASLSQSTSNTRYLQTPQPSYQQAGYQQPGPVAWRNFADGMMNFGGGGGADLNGMGMSGGNGGVNGSGSWSMNLLYHAQGGSQG